MNKLGTLPSVLFGFISGVLLTGTLVFFIYFQKSELTPKDQRAGQIGLINPLIDCPSHPGNTTPNKAELRKKVEILINQAEANDNGVKKVAVYFRDLNNGPTFGINTKDQFIAASLMKLPILIQYLKAATSNPSLLDEKIIFKQDAQESKMFHQSVGQTPLQDGTAYRVQELLEAMITESNNSAASALARRTPQFNYVQLLDQMGVPVVNQNMETYVSVEDFASLYRILYNATFLDQQKSEWALELLAKTKFKNGLVAGVDPGITVAHKFGERFRDSDRYFHDCGIIYYPKRPYLLCVMTQGAKIEDMVEVVKNISAAVFTQVKTDVN